MSTGSYREILKRAREELSGEERLRLISELAQVSAAANGAQDDQRSLYDALTARGLIGFMKDEPSDLSTNPKYMEGFGQHAE
mgnify:CR=1 FL=1